MTIVAIDLDWISKPKAHSAMKNQYFGDRNDYFKYDLLISLAGQLATQKLSVIWMLTENDRSGSGQMIDYGKGAGDTGLYRFLQKSLKEGVRNVIRLDEYFKEAGYEFEYYPYGAERPFLHRDRAAYFDGIPRENLDNAVVFMDPDNGLEVKSIGDGNGDRYVTHNDVAAIYNRMGNTSILVIYQHLPRVHRKLFLYSTFSRLVEKLDCSMPVSIRDNLISFIIFAKTKQRQKEVRQALQEYTRSHLEIYD